MYLALVLMTIALHIVDANGWIIIPTFCLVLCWVVSIVGFFIYSYAKGIGEEFAKTLKIKISKAEKE